MKKILMSVYSHYPQDPRVRREAEALIEEGYQVDLICLKRPNQLKEEMLFGGYVYRVNMTRERSSKFTYFKFYLNFCFRSFFILNWLFIKHRYNYIHIHNMPDFLVFLAILPKIFGSKIILDLHDPSPELLMTIFGTTKNNKLFKIIRWIEKASIKFSNKVITTNQSFLETFISRGCPPQKIRIVMNSPQTSVFEKYIQNASIKPRQEKFKLMYHGVMVERSGLEVLVKALAILRKKITNIELIVCGNGEFEEPFLKDVEKYNVGDIVNFMGKVSIEKIAETIPQIDVGIIPNKITPFTFINFPTRIFEYVSLKKATIVPRTRGIQDYFEEDEIFYFNANDVDDLCRVIMEIYSNPNLVNDTIQKSIKVYEEHTWEIQKNKLIELYRTL